MFVFLQYVLSGRFGILGSSIVLVGLLGNCVSLYLIGRIGKLSITFFLLKCLAIADLTLLLTFAFNHLFQYFVDKFGLNLQVRYTYFYENAFHYVIYPVYCASFTATAWFTCLLTLHR